MYVIQSGNAGEEFASSLTGMGETVQVTLSETEAVSHVRWKNKLG